MIIRLNDLIKRQKTHEAEEKIDMHELITSRQDIKTAEAVQVSYQAEYLQDTIVVNGKFSTTVEFICSRCLCHYNQTIKAPFQETFSQKKEIVEADEEENIHLVNDDQFDLKPYVEENVMLALPFIPLCKDDCEGLCQMCGQNKNEQPCQCKEDKIDPRLAGLKAFFD